MGADLIVGIVREPHVRGGKRYRYHDSFLDAALKRATDIEISAELVDYMWDFTSLEYELAAAGVEGDDIDEEVLIMAREMLLDAVRYVLVPRDRERAHIQVGGKTFIVYAEMSHGDASDGIRAADLLNHAGLFDRPFTLAEMKAAQGFSSAEMKGENDG